MAMPKGKKGGWSTVAARKQLAELALDQPTLTLFPSFTLRQVAILLTCVNECMYGPIVVDGQVVRADEWETIIRQLIRK
jgi:hypothetical protein